MRDDDRPVPGPADRQIGDGLCRAGAGVRAVCGAFRALVAIGAGPHRPRPGAELRATKMLIDMLKDIEKRAGTATPQASPLTPADEEVVENLLARLRRAELAKIHHRDTEV
jgi:hypothetical protein